MAYTMKANKVEISTNGTTWTNVTSLANSISVDGGERMTEDLFVFGADVAEVLAGPREPLEVTLRVVYTEGTNEAWETIRQQYESGGPLYIRWSPLGGTTGKFQFTTDAGVITSFGYPAGESGSANPVLCEVTIRTPKITKSVVA